VTDAWRAQRDPIRRLETYLLRRGWLAAGEREAIAQRIERDVREAIARQEAIGPPPLSSLVDDVFEEPTWLLREQLAELERAPRAKNPHHH
jgi:2-oxoisovalerate dehydrogenase E1 component alpha subunit